MAIAPSCAAASIPGVSLQQESSWYATGHQPGRTQAIGE